MFESHSGGLPHKLTFYSYRINQKWDWVHQFEAYPQLFCSSRDASLLNPGGLIGRYLPKNNIHIYIYLKPPTYTVLSLSRRVYQILVPIKNLSS